MKQRTTPMAAKKQQPMMRKVGAAGTATVVLTGALVVGTAAPAVATVALPVALTTSSNPLQPLIDEMLANTRQAQQAFEALPFATPDNNAMLAASMQATNYELFLTTISRLTHGEFFNQVPEVIAGPAAEYRHYFQFFTPDIYYRTASGFDPDATYVLTGNVGDGTGALALSSLSVGGSSAGGTGATLELGQPGDGLVVNPDGTFTVYIGPERPDGAVNFLDDTGANSLLIRNMLSDWSSGGGNFHIECVTDCPDPFPGISDTGLSDGAIAAILRGINQAVIPFGQLNVGLTHAAGIDLPANTMSDLGSETGFGVGLHSASVSQGNFDLNPGEALIVKVPQVAAGMSGIELMNAYGSNLPATLAQTSLNHSQAFHADDGYTYYVVSASNPGVANWLDTGGLSRGDIFMRYENVPAGTDAEGLGVQTQVVPVDDVSQYLPADTPVVSPEEFAAAMNERVLTYDYTLSLARAGAQHDWVTQNLWMHDLENAMGTDNYHDVFGIQPFTPMWLRLTPALSPDLLAVGKAMLADPSGSLAALQDNWDLAVKDIEQPIQLVQALLVKQFADTVEAVQAALGSDQALPGLLDALVSGGQGFGSILSDALFDPNTSITAGILNARDDLATSVLAGTGGFPTESGPLAAWEWAHMSELVQLGQGAGPADLGALFDLDGIFGS